MYDRFLHKDVLKIFSWIKPRTLISWSERGLIKPDLSDASGRGSARVYSYANLIEIGVVSEFLTYGIPFSFIESILKTPPIAKMRETQNFDVVIWHHHRMRNSRGGPLPSTPEKLHDQPADSPIYATIDTSGITTTDRFLANAGGRMIGDKNVTSAIVINVQAIKMFVDRQLRGLR
jgi:DNA-binding transcriptional MerR regulator